MTTRECTVEEARSSEEKDYWDNVSEEEKDEIRRYNTYQLVDGAWVRLKPKEVAEREISKQKTEAPPTEPFFNKLPDWLQNALRFFGFGPEIKLILTLVEEIAEITEQILATQIISDFLMLQKDEDGARNAQSQISALSQRLEAVVKSAPDDQQSGIRGVAKQAKKITRSVAKRDPKSTARAIAGLKKEHDKHLTRQLKFRQNEPIAIKRLMKARVDLTDQLPTTQILTIIFKNFLDLGEQLSQVFVMPLFPDQDARATISATGVAGGRPLEGRVSDELVKAGEARPIETTVTDSKAFDKGGKLVLEVEGATFLDPEKIAVGFSKSLQCSYTTKEGWEYVGSTLRCTLADRLGTTRTLDIDLNDKLGFSTFDFPSTHYQYTDNNCKNVLTCSTDDCRSWNQLLIDFAKQTNPTLTSNESVQKCEILETIGRDDFTVEVDGECIDCLETKQ